MNETHMKQMAMAQTNAIGSVGGYGLGNQLAQAASAAIGVPIRPDTVRSLLEMAHGRFAELEQEIERLGGLLYPVRSSVPAQTGDQKASYSGDPECIGLLRALCDRISQQTVHVRLISDETRI